MRPIGPCGPCGPVAPVGPCGPVAPVLPIGPCGPCGPVAPVRPIGPCGPCGPVAPVLPIGPCGPCGPVAPVLPIGPCGPCGPCGPDNPVGSPTHCPLLLITVFPPTPTLPDVRRLPPITLPVTESCPVKIGFWVTEKVAVFVVLLPAINMLSPAVNVTVSPTVLARIAVPLALILPNAKAELSSNTNGVTSIIIGSLVISFHWVSL